MHLTQDTAVWLTYLELSLVHVTAACKYTS